MIFIRSNKIEFDPNKKAASLMEPFVDKESYQYTISESDDGDITIYIQGKMDSSNASRMIELFGSLIKDRLPQSLTIDLKKVTYLDDFGALVLVCVIKWCVVNYVSVHGFVK